MLFFLLGDVSTLLFAAAEAFSGFVSLYLLLFIWIRHRPLLSFCMLNYLVAKEIFSFITIILLPLNPFKTHKATLVRGYVVIMQEVFLSSYSSFELLFFTLSTQSALDTVRKSPALT